MQDSIIKYCKERGLKITPGDPEIMKEYERSMREDIIPKIIQDMKDNAKRIAKMRYTLLF